jgi:hypothetical protein
VRVGFIVQGLPGEGYHGGALTCWSVVRELIRSGHQVCVISLFDVTEGNPYLKSRGQQEAALRREGAEVVVIEYAMEALTGARSHDPLAKFGRWIGRICSAPDGLAYLMPWVKLAEEVRRALAGREFDGFLCYHFDALAAVHPLCLSPMLAVVGDLWHLPGYFRWREGSFSLSKYAVRGIRVALESMIAERAMSTLLASTTSCGAFAGHYAEWLKAHGFPKTLYFRTPVPDAAGPKWDLLRSEARAGRTGGKHRVLVIGDLATTSTSSGLRAVAHAVLPRLVDEFGEDGFELRLVGGGAPPNDIAPALRKPYVCFAGRVVPADPEFLAADVMIVPTNIPLGIRVRVITAWSFGCPVVAHRANASGIPEMRHGENSLLADTDAQLVDAVLRVLTDHTLRSGLSAGGRGTFERSFSESVAGQQIVKEMERLAGAQATNRS